MTAYTKTQQKKGKSERLRGERDQIKLIGLIFVKMASCRILEWNKALKEVKKSINDQQ